MRSALLLLALFAVGIFGQAFTFKTNTNVSLSNAGQFSYRRLDFTEINTIFFSEVSIASTSVTINPNSATFDGLYGVAYAGIDKSPASWVLFVNAAANWAGGLPTSNSTNATASASDGFIGSVFISLDEVTANGTLVQTIPFVSLKWAIVDNGPTTGDLRYVTFQGTPFIGNNNFVVNISYIAANRVGVLNVGPLSVITPKAFESVITISNFPYKNVANSARLNIGVASQASTVQVTAQYTHLAGGAGNGATYFSLNNQAVVQGAVANVKISAFTDITDTAVFNNGDVVGKATAKYANAVSFKLVSVTFPPGATSIVFDPSVGAGATPPAITGVTGSGAIASASFALLLLLALLSL